jgi:hypothetical protein
MRGSERRGQPERSGTGRWFNAATVISSQRTRLRVIRAEKFRNAGVYAPACACERKDALAEP